MSDFPTPHISPMHVAKRVCYGCYTPDHELLIHSVGRTTSEARLLAARYAYRHSFEQIPWQKLWQALRRRGYYIWEIEL